MFHGPLFQKGRFKELQFSLKQMIAIHFIYHFNGTLQGFFCLMKTNNENAFPYKFLKIFKRLSFHCQIFLDLKSL